MASGSHSDAVAAAAGIASDEAAAAIGFLETTPAVDANFTAWHASEWSSEVASLHAELAPDLHVIWRLQMAHLSKQRRDAETKYGERRSGERRGGEHGERWSGVVRGSERTAPGRARVAGRVPSADTDDGFTTVGTGDGKTKSRPRRDGDTEGRDAAGRRVSSGGRAGDADGRARGRWSASGGRSEPSRADAGSWR